MNNAEALEYLAFGLACEKILSFMKEEECTSIESVRNYVAQLKEENEKRRN
ncbi:MAG: hypothetical protein FWF82_02005 [Oscillospiraceae bacterium]|nr:hypothetical protein [Oscillospiraceae bacterium]